MLYQGREISTLELIVVLVGMWLAGVVTGAIVWSVIGG